MKIEYEVKFLNIDHDEMRNRLLEAGATCVEPMRLMRRVTFDSPAMKAKNGWVRVRDEGKKVTLTYKQSDALTIDGVKEIETEVVSFDDTVAIFAQTGLAGGSFQESKRESWQLADVQIELDEWPWLEPYIELEGQTAEAITDVASMLGLRMEDALAGDVMVAYRAQYPHLGMRDTVGNLSEVKFGAPLPSLLKP